MACVILPSETARLVYGYLVKENLNDIALQFLESSPYLMDCCQIVKSGYQFNTKLMGKDLPELLQEYSVIHNLVNSKISLLCKTSLLYKRIKLRCENLPEILELILFWKYKNSKSEINSCHSEKSEKNSSGLEVNPHCENSNLGDVSQVKMNENTSDSPCFTKNNSHSAQKDTLREGFHSKLNCDSYSINKELEADERSSSQIEIHELNGLDNNAHNRKTLLDLSGQNEELSENVEKCKTNINNSSSGDTGAIASSNGNVSNNENCLPEPKFNTNTNILTIDINSQCEDLVNDEEMPEDTLVTNEEPGRFENPIKIVGMQEENQNENHSLGVFSKPLGDTEENLNLGSSSVVFVSPDVGNVTINQEQSQIIVIPFDYYKPQNGLQNDMSLDNNKDLGLLENEVNQEKNIIFEEESTTATPSSSTPLFSDQNEKSSAVDENIMTESDFLKNKQLIYNLENELYKTEPPAQQQAPKAPKETMSVQTVSAPVIVVSQPLPTRTSRYRTILPKKEKPVQMHPVVVVHPLLENNKDLTKSKTTAHGPLPETKGRKAFSRRVKNKCTLPQKAKAKEAEKTENVNTVPENITLGEKVVSEGQANIQETEPLLEKEINTGRTQEEKENLEKTENKKNETPVFIMKRNSKRLSLSTPRRRSHIRALEFETPPKTNEEKKKSKTSPKAKVEQVKVERKSVRNTLFKSPIPEDTFKSPVLMKDNKKPQSTLPESLKPAEPVEPLNELSIPIATRSPNTKLSDAWENLTGVGCVIGHNDMSKTSPAKKMWDADLRCFIPDNSQESEPLEKKRMRKPEKNQKDNKKSTKKKIPPPKRIKPIPVTVSPSKISLTAKRNTYSINGNEEGSPIRTLIDDLKIVTPFKDIETIRPTEETPLTKLLRENINTIDIDLSMINTPSFPPTPSIVITPDLDDVSITGTNYYSPTKECSKDKVLKITDYFKVDPEKANKKGNKEMHDKVIDDLISKAKEIIGLGKEQQEENATDYFKVDPEKANKKGNKEMHDKVIDDLVSKAKEIIGLGKEQQEENAMKRRPSGKILSMVKIQMLTQCDKKLMENIPINEETTFSSSFTNQTIIGNLIEETAEKTDLKVELEEKRKRALKKIKVVKENLSQARSRVTKRGRKRKRSVNTTKSDKSRSDLSKDSFDNKQQSIESEESTRIETGLLHSTPYAKHEFEKFEKTDSDKKVNDKILEDIRQVFPPFQNDTQKYPELSEKSRKKLHYVENFLKLPEIVKFLNEFSESNPPKLFLKLSLRRFFHVFYKWLKHPHKRELNASSETNAALKEYLSLFDKVNLGLNHKNKKFKRDSGTPNVSGLSCSDDLGNLARSKTFQSDDNERGCKKRGSEKRKEEDGEDGVVSTLPLKKRKSTVQQVENKSTLATEKTESKNNASESVSQTQNFLQDIDVDRFLSQIHGQETR